MKHHGSCHCGRIRFEVEGNFDTAMSCNCSICSRKGSLLAFVPGADFKLLSPESDSEAYTFHKHVIKHRFCPACGIHPYAEGKDAQGNPMAAINLRCLESFDLDAVKVTQFDGRSR
jgi:hypothetical protein